MFEPVCRKNQIIINKDTPAQDIACLTLWTPREKVFKEWGELAYAAIGQLYSKKRGIVPFLINLAANPQIKTVHVRGVDLDNVKPFLKDLWEHGVSDNENGILTNTVGEEIIELNGLTADVVTSIIDSTELVFINKNRQEPLYIHGQFWKKEYTRAKIILAEPIPSLISVPGEDVVVVRANTVFDVWVKLLDQILRFGHGSGTHYDSDQLEIKDIITVIENENPHNLNFHKDFPFTEEYFTTQYVPTLLRPIKTDTTYNYGHRMMAYFGVNQVQLAVDKLIKQRDSRSVVINLWDPKNDFQGKGSPCLNHIWLRIENDHLTMVCTIRSNDMFAGYPENALALRVLQEEIRLNISEEDAVGLGPLIIHSLSAHLYSDTFDDAMRISSNNIDDVLSRDLADYDVRGAFEISDNVETIEVRHVSPTGNEVDLWSFKSTHELEMFVLRMITDPKHIMYLAQEIYKITYCRRSNKNYKQGMNLW